MLETQAEWLQAALQAGSSPPLPEAGRQRLAEALQGAQAQAKLVRKQAADMDAAMRSALQTAGV